MNFFNPLRNKWDTAHLALAKAARAKRDAEKFREFFPNFVLTYNDDSVQVALNSDNY